MLVSIEITRNVENESDIEIMKIRTTVATVITPFLTRRATLYIKFAGLCIMWFTLNSIIKAIVMVICELLVTTLEVFWTQKTQSNLCTMTTLALGPQICGRY